jgi:uncharacterized protein (TIGR04255 family)
VDVSDPDRHGRRFLQRASVILHALGSGFASTTSRSRVWHYAFEVISTDDVYPNSPLRGVVFEVRFPGEPAVECHRDQLFARVREHFPQVLVPKLREGEAAALTPYHFQNADGSAALLTAMNLFAYRTSSYGGFATFRSEALRWLAEFRQLFAISRLNRTGLRYTNVIPYPPGQGFPLAHFLNLQINLGGQRIERFEQFFMTSRIPVGDGFLTIQIGDADVEGGDAIVLDFDFAKEGELLIDDIETHLDQSHEETKRLFESLLTEGYRAYLRGEELR